MEDLWTNRAPPKPLSLGSLDGIPTGPVDSSTFKSASPSLGLKDTHKVGTRLAVTLYFCQVPIPCLGLQDRVRCPLHHLT